MVLPFKSNLRLWYKVCEVLLSSQDFTKRIKIIFFRIFPLATNMGERSERGHLVQQWMFLQNCKFTQKHKLRLVMALYIHVQRCDIFEMKLHVFHYFLKFKKAALNWPNAFIYLCFSFSHIHSSTVCHNKIHITPADKSALAIYTLKNEKDLLPDVCQN